MVKVGRFHFRKDGVGKGKIRRNPRKRILHAHLTNSEEKAAMFENWYWDNHAELVEAYAENYGISKRKAEAEMDRTSDFVYEQFMQWYRGLRE